MNLYLSRFLVFLCILFAPLNMALAAAHPKTQPSAKKQLVNITITGIKDQTILKNVDSAVNNIKSLHLTKPINDDSIYSVYHDTPEGIKKAMQPYGYFNVTVSSSFKNVGGYWYMDFTVRPGSRSKVSGVNIIIDGPGTTDQNFLPIIDHYPLKKGQYFSLEKYNLGNDMIFEHAANLGYFTAKMEVNKIVVNLNKHTVLIKLRFDTGKRHWFGHTHFSKTPLNIKFLRRYLAYKEGQRYDNALVQQTQNNLADSNYFSQIVVSPEVSKSHNSVTPMDVKLKMRKRKAYTFGLGYSTDTQIRGTAAFKYRWVNSWGHYFDARAQGSFVNYSFVTAYNIPWPNPMKDLFSLKAGVGRLNVTSGSSNSKKVSLEYRHVYTKWSHTVAFNWLNERYDITNLPKTRAKLFYPSGHVSYYSTRNHIDPDTGVRFTADIAGTPSALSSTSGFFQFKMESKAVYTFWKYEQLMARLAYGRTQINNINNLPFSLQFLIGGSQTVRGYSYQSIGPGRQMLYGSGEFRQRIWNQVFVAGFFDFGNVTDQGLFGNIRAGTGPSILYRSPIGVIQLSVAWRLQKNRQIKPRFVFSMGPEL